MCRRKTVRSFVPPTLTVDITPGQWSEIVDTFPFVQNKKCTQNLTSNALYGPVQTFFEANQINRSLIYLCERRLHTILGTTELICCVGQCVFLALQLLWERLLLFLLPFCPCSLQSTYFYFNFWIPKTAQKRTYYQFWTKEPAPPFMD